MSCGYSFETSEPMKYLDRFVRFLFIGFIRNLFSLCGLRYQEGDVFVETLLKTGLPTIAFINFTFFIGYFIYSLIGPR